MEKCDGSELFDGLITHIEKAPMHTEKEVDIIQRKIDLIKKMNIQI